MFEEVSGRLRRLLKEAGAQDVVLRDLAKQRTPELTVAGARPLIALFNDAGGVLNDVPKYEYYADPASARSQIARLIVQIESAIEQINADEAAHSGRNVLAVPHNNAIELLRRRLSEGSAFLDSYVVHEDSEVRIWSLEVTQTLRRLFKTPWHANKFDREVEEQFGDGPGGRPAATGLSYLKLLLEDLLTSEPVERLRPEGDAVFIAHGRSPAWRELKDHLQDVLHLKHIEFNSDPIPGYSTHERILEMLGRSKLALLVFTPEDQQADGTFRARENVVYEAGMWMGHFGPKRAIILRDSKCAVPSNLDGITRIEFSDGKIRSTFVDVREVLFREGVLPPERR